MSQADTIREQQVDTALADIGALYEPPPVEFTFDAVGWTYLVWVLVSLVLVGIFIFIRKYMRNKYRRDALAALKQADSMSVSEVFVILKQTAMHVFSRETTGNLHGNQWLEFLDNTGKGVQFSRYQNEITQALYKDETTSADVMDAILSNAQKWIRTHAG